MQITSLLDTESLTQGLAKETRSERMEQRVKPSMKQIIEYAATLSGTDTSEFVSTAAFQAAMDKIGALSHTRLDGEDATRFFAALERKPEPNQAMKELMAGYDESLDEA